MKLAIHQPNFLPWLGIFHRLAQADTFVFFDHVQSIRGKSWLSRNKILQQGSATWLTVPILRKGESIQTIDQVKINNEHNFSHKHLRTIELNYKKTPHFGEIFTFLSEHYQKEEPLLANFNKTFIANLCHRLDITPNFINSSQIMKEQPELSSLKGNELVLAICQQLKANHYISGTGCLDFIEPESFKAHNINFQFQQFTHPIYPQLKTTEFIPNLSVIDALFNIGFKGVKEVLK